MTDSTSGRPWLAADIGGTHARFGLVDGTGQLTLRFEKPTAALGAGEAFVGMVRQCLQDAGHPTVIGGACIAMAGPVVAGQGALSNGVLRLEERALTRDFGAPVRLVNDFYALAHRVPACEALTPLGDAPGLPAAVGPRVVLGPGTGLGTALLLPAGPGRWQVWPSEAGQSDLAPVGQLELELARVLDQHHGHLCWERVLSGPGLVSLYRALADLWGAAPDPAATPAWIVEQGRDAQVPLCHQTLDVFCNLLGGFAGNLALTCCATGGVYLAGGVTQVLQNFIPGSGIRRRFDSRGVLSDYVARIPLLLIREADAGLRGAAALVQAGRPAA